MGELFSYPFSSIPISLSHVDCSTHKSPKSGILNHLEVHIITAQVKRVHKTTVDTMFFFHLHLNLPMIVGGLAIYQLSRVLEMDG